MDDQITQARRMHYLSRGHTFRTPHLSRNTPLPPRDLFTDEPDVLELYDRFTNLGAAVKKHETDARTKRAAAATAQAAYKAAVSEAMATGKDTAKVTNDAPRLTAEAEHHDALAREAITEQDRISHPLAAVIAEAAPRLLQPSEDAMREAARTVEAAISGLHQAWSDWASAWHLRRLLGSAALSGGGIHPYRSNAPMPTDVAAALATLTDQLDNLDRLKSDEANVKAWREQEAAAHAANERKLDGVRV
jgi:hypothetical protein